MHSLEAHQINNNHSITHGLYQSLESEKVRQRAHREDQVETHKQFESIEPSRQLAAYEASLKRE